MNKLHGKIAVVTGGSRGLGRRIAEVLTAQGAIVAILSRNAGDVANVAAEIGGSCFGVACDVSNPDSIRHAFQTIAAPHGRVDILVNNAAITELGRIADATDDAISREIATNLAGPIFCCREAIPLMRVAGGGEIVNISSEAVDRPIPFLSIYASTKGGLEVFTAGLRGEVRDENVRVTLVRTGHLTESSISAHWSPEARRAWMETLMRSGHANLGDDKAFSPSIVADAIVTLLNMPRTVNVNVIDIRSSGWQEVDLAKAG